MSTFAAPDWSSGDEGEEKQDVKIWQEDVKVVKAGKKHRKKKKQAKAENGQQNNVVEQGQKAKDKVQANGGSGNGEVGSLLRQGIKFASAEEFEAFKQGRNKKAKKRKNDDEATATEPSKKKQCVNGDAENKGQQQQSSSKFDIAKLKSALNQGKEVEPTTTVSAQEESKKKTGFEPVVSAAKTKLKASRFRYLNELLYTQSGRESLKMFSQDPEAFSTYHEGYADQVKKWPLNPLDLIIKAIQSRKKKMASLVVADFGCGEARLAQTLATSCKRIHSFDLVALNQHVTVCDFAKTPLDKGSVDVAVFCLSLMGPNLADFLREANRVLKVDGTLKIAEVESRFLGDNEAKAFVSTVEKFGFALKWKDLQTSDYFYLMDFKKVADAKSKLKKGMEDFSLKPCLYKKR